MRGRPRAGTAPRDRVDHHTRFSPRVVSLQDGLDVAASAFAGAEARRQRLAEGEARRDQPNTVAHSSGAVVCPDEASARRHRERATWWDERAEPEGGYVGPVWDAMTESVVARYRWTYGPRWRWTS